MSLLFRVSKAPTMLGKREVRMRWIVTLGLLGLLMFPRVGGSVDAVDCRVTPKFSSQGSIAQAVMGAIRETNERIDLALYGFNNDDLAQELLRLARRGVIVRLKIDDAKAHSKKTARFLKTLAKSGVQISSVAQDGRNHNKFAVIDGRRVLTGSYNWTKKAESNWENLLILDCAGLASTYEKEWEKIH